MRKITVVSSDTQTKVTFETEATTVAELKAELDARGINYADKELFEGISHTVLNLSIDETVLPHDNTYRGVVTNDLVVMVTSGKKIKNGMDRASVYAHIREMGLAEAIKQRFGKNYTNIPTETLVEFVTNSQPAAEKPTEEETACESGCPLGEFMGACLTVALKNGLIEADTIVHALHEAGCIKFEKGDDVKSSFSDDDIQDMFKGYC